VTADLAKHQSVETQQRRSKAGRALLKRLRLLYQPLLNEISRFAPDVQVAAIARHKERCR